VRGEKRFINASTLASSVWHPQLQFQFPHPHFDSIFHLSERRRLGCFDALISYLVCVLCVCICVFICVCLLANASIMNEKQRRQRRQTVNYEIQQTANRHRYSQQPTVCWLTDSECKLFAHKYLLPFGSAFFSQLAPCCAFILAKKKQFSLLPVT